MVLPDLLVRHSRSSGKIGSMKPRSAIAKRGYYPCIKETVSILNPKTKRVIVIVSTIALAAVWDAPTRGSVPKSITVQTAASSQPNVKNLQELIAGLKRRGKKLGRKEKVEQPFLSVKGQIISVDDQEVQVFEYRNVLAAELDKKKINDTRATSMAMWIAPPHFFWSGRLIVLYVGEAPSMLATLTELLGPQFAGNRTLTSAAVPSPQPGGWNRVILQVDDLPARIETLKKAGLHFRNAMEVGPGGKQIQLKDPDGNPIELFEPAQR